jgi:hypothetical protein
MSKVPLVTTVCHVSREVSQRNVYKHMLTVAFIELLSEASDLVVSR